jgi:hypothetical protein
MTAASRFLVIILVVLGVLAIAAGIIYYVEPAKSLPTFFPGHLAHGNGGTPLVAWRASSLGRCS